MMAIQVRTAAPKPLACEIDAYTEEELDRHLEENGRIVSVQDPENISLAFIQRLRDIVQRGREATESHAVDLDEVAARLQAIPADPELFNRSPSVATTKSLPSQEELDREDLREETESYHALVNAGGRPPYPFHLLEDLLWNPEKYLEHKQYGDIVLFWRAAERTCVCACQLSRWRRFRNLQRIIRERGLKSEWTLIDASDWDSWEVFVNQCGPKEGQWGFPEYTERMRRRLTKYGFTRSFQLDRDPNNQDKLTTWIEYLGFEYYFYDVAASYVKGFQRRHDDAWKKLVDTNLLKPDETYEVICNIETAFRHSNEEEIAEKATKSAAAAVSSTEKAIAESQVPGEILQKRLLADQSVLTAAKEKQENIRARNDAVTAFLQEIRQYRRKKCESNRHRCLLRWIEQQIPSIELELCSVDGADDHSNQKEGSKRLKRTQPDEPNELQHTQEYRFAEGDTQSVPSQRILNSSPSASYEMPKRRGYNSISDGRSPKRHKNDRSDLASHFCPDSSASAKSPRIQDRKMIHEMKGGSVRSKEPSRELKPLRRSARIANKAAACALIVDTPTPLPSMAPENFGLRSAVRRVQASRPTRDGK